MKYRRALRPTTALATTLQFDENRMYVTLQGGRLIGVPLIRFPLLHEASPKARQQYEIGGGVSLHWPEIDEDISIAGLLAGADVQST